jgi:hypothetical protein
LGRRRSPWTTAHPPPTTYTSGRRRTRIRSHRWGGAGGAGSGGADRGSPRTMPAPGENPVKTTRSPTPTRRPGSRFRGRRGWHPSFGRWAISDGGAMAGGSGWSAGEGGGGGEPIGDGPCPVRCPVSHLRRRDWARHREVWPNPPWPVRPRAVTPPAGPGWPRWAAWVPQVPVEVRVGDQERTNPYRIDGGIFDNNGTGETNQRHDRVRTNTESSVQFSR